MNLLLIDTSAFIEFARGHSILLDKLRLADRILLSPIVMGELLYGLARSPSTSQKKALEEFVSSSRVDQIVIDEETPTYYAIIRSHLTLSGFSIGQNDLWIAASTMQHGAKLLTTDSDFLRVPQILVDCLDPA